MLDDFKKKAKANPKTIILPESSDERVLKAASVVLKEGIAKIILIDKDDSALKKAKELKLDISKAQIINPNKYQNINELAQKLYELRKEKGMTLIEAKKLVLEENHFSIMLLHESLADGVVSGAIHTTADLIRPALQIIRTTKGTKTASSFFFMITENKTYLFADCAFVTNPTSEQLCEIAIATANSARKFGIEPKVALLSFSTKGSGKDPMVDKVQDAVKLLQKKKPNFIFDGELQLDSAIVPSVAEKKCPNSPIKGNANVLIFPDLNSGNIGYKLVQRFSNTKAIGPFIQGLNKPVNDLSRGCFYEDIVQVITITVLEAQ
jgi:phosphate acetyltransferase